MHLHDVRQQLLSLENALSVALTAWERLKGRNMEHLYGLSSVPSFDLNSTFPEAWIPEDGDNTSSSTSIYKSYGQLSRGGQSSSFVSHVAAGTRGYAVKSLFIDVGARK